VVPPALRDAPPELLLPLCDVLPTGHHAAMSAGVKFGHRVAIVGDGAVGLCAVLAARRLGAESVTVIGHHEQRLEVARRLGATDVVHGRGERVAEEVITLTGGAHAVLECVGAQPALSTAIAVARDGATIGYVGVPHLVEGLDLSLLFGRNIDLAGGVTPARTYLPELMTDIALGTIDASPIFDAVGRPGRRAGRLPRDGRAQGGQGAGGRLDRLVDGEPDRDHVTGRGDHGAQVEHLVVAERARPRVGPLQPVHDPAEGVDQAAGDDQDERGHPAVPEEARQHEHGHPAETEVERHGQPARCGDPARLEQHAAERAEPDHARTPARSVRASPAGRTACTSRR
jgi:hypothetical protein